MQRRWSASAALEARFSKIEMSYDNDFVAGAVLPSQFADLFRSVDVSAPERKLTFAIVEDALSLYSKGEGKSTKSLRDFLEVRSWLLDARSNQTFSSNWCFDFLSIDSDAIRNRLRSSAPEQIHVNHRHDHVVRSVRTVTAIRKRLRKRTLPTRVDTGRSDNYKQLSW